MSQSKVIPEGSVEGQASRGDARYLYPLRPLCAGSFFITICVHFLSFLVIQISHRLRNASCLDAFLKICFWLAESGKHWILFTLSLK